MKIEIGESLGYSYLRHVKECWLVQTNWKPSPHWPRFMDDAELDEMFAAMKARFDDAGGKVFKQTKTAAQFIQQAEIDVMGVDREGGVYAIDIAFHEAGLNYLGGPENRVLKKLLRTMMTLQAYHPTETQLHITFASPKVNPGVQKPLEALFNNLGAEYPEVVWDLLTNDAFAERLLQPTLQKAAAVSDTAELFMRSVKLLDVAKPQNPKPNGRQSRSPNPDPTIQPLVRDLMQTLLEDHPTLLEEFERGNLMDEHFCRHELGLQINNFPLLRPQAEGRKSPDGRDRYYQRLYAGRFYVCSQWWRAHHLSNAQSLLQFVDELAQRKPNHPGMLALERSRKDLQEYVG
ncbi:MAG: hypothetical protein OXC99_09280 [Chloroflexi bacterium]|nr:hypothetical protein [Chloroflexota bacterium]